MTTDCALIAEHVRTGLHDRIKADDALWQQLPCVGHMMGLELRNCDCQSTLAREMIE